METSGGSQEFRLRSATVSEEVTLAFDEWPANGPRVLFLHATGFSRGCWRPHARQLASRSQPTLVDLRGHGASSKPPAPYRWPELADDVATLLTTEDWSGVILLGHSVGGATAVEVAARLPERVAGLVLVEAVVPLAPPPGDGAAPVSPLVERTLKRRAHWPSRQEAGEYLRSRAPYDSWDAEVFAAWTETGLVEAEGGVELSCPPWAEAAVFGGTRESRAGQVLGDVECPVWILRATGERGMRSTTSPEVAPKLRTESETVVEGSGHFLPLERVDLVVDTVDAALEHVQGRRAQPASSG